MAEDAELMEELRRRDRPSRWGGRLQPPRRKAGTSEYSKHSLRPLAKGNPRVSSLGIGSRKKDADQLHLEFLFTEYARQKVEKEKLLHDDDTDSRNTRRGSDLRLLSEHGWREQQSESGSIQWDMVESAQEDRSGHTGSLS